MATQPQIRANRQNAQKSTGPKTQKGKTTVSQNALKHGLSARQDVIVTENQEDYDLHRDSLIEELAPQTQMEVMLAHRIISLSWRLKRADIIQNQTFDAIHERNESDPFPDLTKTLIRKALHSPNPQPSAPQNDLTLGRIALKDFANERVLDRLLMYERRIENSLHKTILELQRLTLIREMTPTPSSDRLNPPDTRRGDPMWSPRPKSRINLQKPRIHHPESSIKNPPLDNCRATSTNPPFSRKTNPIPKTTKSTQPQTPQRVIEKSRPSVREKTNPIKPNLPARKTTSDIKRSEIPMHIGIRYTKSEPKNIDETLHLL